MIYFIGGPPRVGKSMIAGTIARQHGISAVSTDSLGAVLEAILPPESNPDVFAIARFNELPEADRVELMAETPARRLDDQIRESTAVWQAVEPFILREQEEKRDVVVEGVAVLPELVAQLEGVEYRAVFVGNQSHTLKENIRRSAEENPQDWMRLASDEYVVAFAACVDQMSAYIEREAFAFGFNYIEMGKSPFEDALGQAAAALLR